MPPVVEARADAALVAVLTSEGEIRGTGFLIDGNGTVLTCHHVVDGLMSVLLRGPDGTAREVGSDLVDAAPEIDLALIRASGLSGFPLPLVTGADATTEYWTKGFHRLGDNVRAAFPVQGSLIGTTNVSYVGENACYDIDHVFVLRDDVIDYGLSGAPVLDRKVGVVIGVVSTKLVRQHEAGGFAIPVDHAAAHPVLASAVAANQASVPAYGPYLNVPAAHELCTAVTTREIENLHLRGVDLDRRVPRSEFDQAVASFLGGDAPVLALIGPSGVGKSTELAALAQRIRDRALLLRGSSMGRDSTGLGEAVKGVLKSAGSALMPEAADIVVAHALEAGAGLIVVLDALNEAPLTGVAFEEWISETRSWLRDAHARLVISCRPELWTDVVSRPLSATDLEGRKPMVEWLGGFTNGEYASAARVYGIAQGLNVPILRLPVALSLWARLRQVSSADNGANVALNDVIEAYVVDAARRLAKSGSSAPSSAQVMKDRLVEAGARMWSSGTDVLDVQALGEVFGTTMTDSVVIEGVMTSTPTGYRFVYDEVSDWLQAQRLDLNEELAAIAHGARAWRAIGPVSSALRDIERHEGPEALCVKLTRLINNAKKFYSMELRVVEQTLLKVADARPYNTVLDLIIDLTVASPPLHPAPSFAFWSTVSLPLLERLERLRRLLSVDLDYGALPEDWEKGDYYSEESNTKLIYDLVKREPSIGIPAILPWLDDPRQKVGDEATLPIFVMSILYRLRLQAQDIVWSAMIKRTDQCVRMMSDIADNDPKWLIRMMTSEHGEDSYAVVTAGYYLSRPRTARTLSKKDTETFYGAVIDRYNRGLHDKALGMALNTLINGPVSHAYIEAVVHAFNDRLSELGSSALKAALYRDTDDIVLPVLLKSIGRDQNQRADALIVISESEDSRVQAAGDHAVRRYLEKGSAVDYMTGRYAENRLNRSGVVGEDLIAIIRRIIASPESSGRSSLVYALTKADMYGDWTQHIMLLKEFIDGPADTASIQNVVEKLTKGIAARHPIPDAFALLVRALGRVDATSADRILLSLAIDRFADLIVQWLIAGKLAAPGQYTARLKALVEEGLEPRDAAREIAMTIWNSA